MNKRYCFIFLAVFLVILAGCGQKTGSAIAVSDSKAKYTDNPDYDTINTDDDTVQATKFACEITINVLTRGPKEDAWSFEPSEIKVKQGAKVKLLITTPDDDVDHAISIPEFNVNKVMLKKGTTETVQFTADKKGEFSFFCSLYCGEGHKS